MEHMIQDSFVVYTTEAKQRLIFHFKEAANL